MHARNGPLMDFLASTEICHFRRENFHAGKILSSVLSMLLVITNPCWPTLEILSSRWPGRMSVVNPAILFEITEAVIRMRILGERFTLDCQIFYRSTVIPRLATAFVNRGITVPAASKLTKQSQRMWGCVTTRSREGIAVSDRSLLLRKTPKLHCYTQLAVVALFPSRSETLLDSLFSKLKSMEIWRDCILILMRSRSLPTTS